ncbi:MAG: PIG-L family deacetylase [Planctomycetota bacterium]|nr:PIG-L family deacetylase [Planctomycetota bacterium]
MSDKVAFAVVAHPDDIEFMMAGTLILLGQAGFELNYMTVANGSCGTATQSKDEIVAIRTAEARSAAEMIGAQYHPPLVGDTEIFYDQVLISRLCAIVRRVNPQILLLPSPQDYTEDHIDTSRLMVTAAFLRGVKNYLTDPQMPTVQRDMAIYHCMPIGLVDQLRRPVRADAYVDISDVFDQKLRMLKCHRSQKEWLDYSQGLDSYLAAMEQMSLEIGKRSKKFKYAEGWQRHLHLGFGPEQFDPLQDALKNLVIIA